MGRKSATRALSIWTNGLRVGTWRIPVRGDMELIYDAGWKQSAIGRAACVRVCFIRSVIRIDRPASRVACSDRFHCPHAKFATSRLRVVALPHRSSGIAAAAPSRGTATITNLKAIRLNH